MGNAVQHEATVCVAQESIRWKGNRIRDNEDTCKDGDSDAYKCVYVIVQSRQKKKKHAPLTQKEKAHAYRSVVWVSMA